MKAKKKTVLGSTSGVSATRCQTGVYMVEMLMAIAISSMLAAALVSSMAESERLTSYGQNQLMAATIAQEQLDTARRIPYSSLVQLNGQEWVELKVSPDSPHGMIQKVISPRPLLIRSSKFTGRVYERVQEFLPPQNGLGYLKIQIKVVWTEADKNWEYQVETLVFDNGVNGTGTASS